MTSNYFEQEGVSNSSLSLFNYDPSAYYRTYVLKEAVKKEDSDSMLLGSLVHCLVLEPENFNSMYKVSDLSKDDIPTAMMLDYVNGLIEAGSEDDFAHETAYLKSGYKTTKEKVRENFNKAGGYKLYIKEMLSSIPVINANIYDKAKRLASIVYNDYYWKQKEALHSLYDSCQIHNELEHYWLMNLPTDMAGTTIKLKSKLDRLYVQVNHGNKEVSVCYIDIKTDSKNPVHLYNKTFEYWKTYRQLAFYKLAILDYIGKQYPNYTVESSFHIMAVDVVREKTLLYNIDKSQLDRGLKEITEDFRNLLWHIETDMWEYPRNIYEQVGGPVLSYEEKIDSLVTV